MNVFFWLSDVTVPSKSIEFAISNDTVASVEASLGIVTALEIGTTVVTVLDKSEFLNQLLLLLFIYFTFRLKFALLSNPFVFFPALAF
jgi:hypothetical protein